MNIFSRFYCRVHQIVLRIFMPMIPYKEPTLLKNCNELMEVLKNSNKSQVLIVTGKIVKANGLIKELEETLNNSNINYTIYDNTVANPTTQNVEEALNVYKANNCDCIIAFGGGSPIDCAKAVGARVACPNKTLNDMKGLLKVNHKLPLLIAIPTTAGTGSEATLTSVITDSETHHKYTINDFDLIPSYALLDANLTISLPKHITATTGMDALTHAIEAYIGRSTTKTTRKNALNAIKLIFENLGTAYKDGANFEARENMLKASYYAGLAFSKSYVGYIHAIAHSLGGKYNVPHGLANAVIMPFVLKMYGKSVYKKLWQIGIFIGLFDETTERAEGARLLIKKIEELSNQINIPESVEGIQTEDIPQLAKIAAKEANPLYPVPKLFTAKDLEIIYHAIR